MDDMLCATKPCNKTRKGIGYVRKTTTCIGLYITAFEYDDIANRSFLSNIFIYNKGKMQKHINGNHIFRIEYI